MTILPSIQVTSGLHWETFQNKLFKNFGTKIWRVKFMEQNIWNAISIIPEIFLKSGF